MKAKEGGHLAIFLMGHLHSKEGKKTTQPMCDMYLESSCQELAHCAKLG